MTEYAKWIWLDKKIYPNLQLSSIYFFSADRMKYKFGVAAFKREYRFDKIIKYAEIEAFGDTRCYLWQNGEFVGYFTCPAGGDAEMPYQYSNVYKVEINRPSVEFLARVQLTNITELDTSRGRGGFILSARLVFEDGTETTVCTDETWLARCEREYLSPRMMDYTLTADEWYPAEVCENVWNLVSTQLKPLKEETVHSKSFVIEANTKKEFYVPLDKIYSAYTGLKIKAEGIWKIQFISSEINGISERRHKLKGKGNADYRALEMDSIGEYTILVENESDMPMEIQTEIYFVCYSSEEKGNFSCSENLLNEIYELGKWSVKICRQGIELDSPMHQENLLCTGDYMVESLVNNCTTGDYSLTRMDIIRTAYLFEKTGGYMFHITYALMWPMWAYHYYMYSGDAEIFTETLRGMEILLNRYEGFENNKGLLEYVTNYMFVDWAWIDGYSLHHPPRALGETVLNAFYYSTLTTVTKIYRILNQPEKAEQYAEKSRAFKEAFNKTFFDTEKNLYFDGLNAPTECNQWLPENSEKRYYTVYSNTLAVLFDLCPEEKQRSVMEEILDTETAHKAQPYFLHYILDAIYKTGLFEKYGLDLIRRWERLVKECNKGMKEVFEAADDFVYDYSHGWGATPTYQLPVRLSGLEILEPGFRKIRLKPCLYGLKSASIKMPTPYGEICCEMEEGKQIKLTVPKEIEVEE